jgi:hypothetical protein
VTDDIAEDRCSGEVALLTKGGVVQDHYVKHVAFGGDHGYRMFGEFMM